MRLLVHAIVYCNCFRAFWCSLPIRSAAAPRQVRARRRRHVQARGGVPGLLLGLLRRPGERGRGRGGAPAGGDLPRARSGPRLGQAPQPTTFGHHLRRESASLDIFVPKHCFFRYSSFVPVRVLFSCWVLRLAHGPDMQEHCCRHLLVSVRFLNLDFVLFSEKVYYSSFFTAGFLARTWAV